MAKYAWLASTQSNPTLMGGFYPIREANGVGLGFNKKNQNGFGLGPGIMQTQLEPNPYTYIILKKN